MAYRPRFSIYTPTRALRFPEAWTVMEMHEAQDGKLRSTQRTREFMWWQPAERKYLKPLQTGAYGAWCVIRASAQGKDLSRRLRWK